MTLDINIKIDNQCKLCIKPNITDYLPDDADSYLKDRFKKSDLINISTLQYNKSNEVITEQTVINDYNTEVQVKNDGWITVSILTLPSKEWFLKEYNKTHGSALQLYDIIYFTDQTDYFKYSKSTGIVCVTQEEVLEINPVNTTIYKASKDAVVICFLQKCYINLCYQIFNNSGFSPCFNKNDNKDLKYKRDILQMALAAIKYLTEMEQLAEAQRLIEIINGCNGLCTNDQITNHYVEGCRSCR